MFCINKCPVSPYNKHIEIITSPEPTKLMIKYRNAALAVSGDSLTATIAHAAIVLISMKT